MFYDAVVEFCKRVIATMSVRGWPLILDDDNPVLRNLPDGSHRAEGEAAPPATNLSDADCPFCLSPLSTAPALQLPACRHAYHAECLRDAVHAGRPGPAVTFAHLACPQCGLGGSSWTAMVRAPTTPKRPCLCTPLTHRQPTESPIHLELQHRSS